MLEQDSINTAMSLLREPVLSAPRKDENSRFYIDFRPLNVVTVLGSYPLHRTDFGIDQLGDATVLTALDSHVGYWQVRCAKVTRTKRRFYVMLPGLIPIPAYAIQANECTH